MEVLRELAALIKNSDRIFVLTGAGISTESGIPDFRGPEGLYTKYPAYMFEVDFLRENPAEFYKVYRELLEMIINAQPNPAHVFLARLEKVNKIHCIATQNIDGLHHKAGSKKVVELHGNALRFYCEKCGTQKDVFEILDVLNHQKVPFCECGGFIRPDVVFFGEPLKEENLMYAFKMSQEADLHIVMGSSLVVYPAASLPLVAIEKHIPLVIINLGETHLDPYCKLKINAPLAEVCSKLSGRIGL
ncbi:MAG: NAD-dependent protein deacylase [candidate division WOR-3 bacterium]